MEKAMNSEALPDEATNVVESSLTWIRNHPTEAALAGAVGGFLVGLTGVGRIVRGVKFVRSLPFASQVVFGIVSQGLGSRALAESRDPVH
jgi:hypothetical protein